MKEKKVKESKVKANSFGAAGFTLAVSSIAILFLGIYGILAMPIVGFIFCLVQQKKKPTRLGKAGLILSLISAVIFVIYFLWIGPWIMQVLQNYPTQ
jgi:Na+-driven multidrug efflux pump